jgi:hypothetical protein
MSDRRFSIGSIHLSAATTPIGAVCVGLAGICFEEPNRCLIYLVAMSKTLLLLALMLLLVGCGSTTPCDDSDPVGICANSHCTVPTGT